MNKPAKKTITTKKNKDISVKELKFWLEGIMEFQTDDWIPSAPQWKTIYDKIMALREVADVVNVVQSGGGGGDSSNYTASSHGRYIPDHGTQVNDFGASEPLIVVPQPTVPMNDAARAAIAAGIMYDPDANKSGFS